LKNLYRKIPWRHYNFRGDITKFRRKIGNLYKMITRAGYKISSVIIAYKAQLVYNNQESGKTKAEQEIIYP